MPAEGCFFFESRRITTLQGKTGYRRQIQQAALRGVTGARSSAALQTDRNLPGDILCASGAKRMAGIWGKIQTDCGSHSTLTGSLFELANLIGSNNHQQEDQERSNSAG
ncbi:MAG: hypothetical protein WB622_15085 [Acidobacteriaceae bacterium]